MKIMTKSFGAVVILGALAGCAGDEGAPAPGPAATPGAGQSPAPKAGPMKTDLPTRTDLPTTTTPAGKIEPSTTPPSGKAEGAPPKVEGPSKSETPKPTGAAAKLSDKELANIKGLPQAEQDAAIAQAVCPVSGHHLGSMDKPLKVSAEGRTFYICCDGCEEEVKTKGKEVVAKLDKLKSDK